MTFTGRYDITIATPLGPQHARLTLTQTATTLTGHAEGDIGQVPLTGTVTDETAHWKMSVTTPMPLTLDVTATATADAITGTVKAGFFGTYPLIGTRVG